MNDNDGMEHGPNICNVKSAGSLLFLFIGRPRRGRERGEREAREREERKRRGRRVPERTKEDERRDREDRVVLLFCSKNDVHRYIWLFAKEYDHFG